MTLKLRLDQRICIKGNDWRFFNSPIRFVFLESSFEVDCNYMCKYKQTKFMKNTYKGLHLTYLYIYIDLHTIVD